MRNVLHQWKLPMKYAGVFVACVLLALSILVSRPYSLVEPPLFNPARGFSMAVLVAGGPWFGIPLILASFVSNLLFLKHTVPVSLFLAVNNCLSMWLGAILVKKLCRKRNPALNLKDWLIFIFAIVPICLTVRFALDAYPLKGVFTFYKFSWDTLYRYWLWVDALGIILTMPFFSEVFYFFSHRGEIKELLPGLLPFAIGNLLGIFVFINPHFEKLGLPEYLPFYLSLVGMIGVAYSVAPLLVSFSLVIQSFWAAWGRDGVLLGIQDGNLQNLWDIRIFLFALGILIPVIATMFRRSSEISSEQVVSAIVGKGNSPDLALAVSHDLQEPLRNVTQALEILNQKYLSDSDPEAKNYIDLAMQSQSKVKRMIRGALELTKLDFNQSPQEKIDTNMLVQECIGGLSQQFKEIGAVVKVRTLPPIHANKELVSRVFQNLLSNSCKYRSQRPLAVVISAKKSGKWVRFTVSDNGLGFDMKDAKRIFSPYQRLFTQEEIEGSGLGLSICQRIIEIHGGEISAESELGQGATFHFTLPLV